MTETKVLQWQRGSLFSRSERSQPERPPLFMPLQYACTMGKIFKPTLHCEATKGPTKTLLAYYYLGRRPLFPPLQDINSEGWEETLSSVTQGFFAPFSSSSSAYLMPAQPRLSACSLVSPSLSLEVWEENQMKERLFVVATAADFFFYLCRSLHPVSPNHPNLLPPFENQLK